MQPFVHLCKHLVSHNYQLSNHIVMQIYKSMTGYYPFHELSHLQAHWVAKKKGWI